MQKKEYLIEMCQVGTSMRVTALDPVTGQEAVILGPPAAGQSALKSLAVRKLERKLNKRNSEDA